MRRSGLDVPYWRASTCGIVLAAALAAGLGGCSTIKDDDVQTVAQPIPAHGHPYFDLKYRIPMTARRDAPDAAWKAETLDTCYSNGVCAVQGIADTPSWGLTLRCNGDPTCEQSTYHIVPVGLRSGVRIKFDPDAAGDGQTLWSSITADRSVPAGLLTVRYATKLATGPGTGWTIGRINTQILCGVALNTCPQLDVLDTFVAGSPVVSGNPPPKRVSVVGREANFVARAKPGSGAGSYRVANVAWGASGWLYKPYPFTGAPPTPLGWTDLHYPNLNVFWAGGGDQHVAATATLVRSDNQEISHASTQVDYNVGSPAVLVAMLVHPERIKVGTRTDAGGQWLRWGSNAKNAEAIGFRYSMTNDHGFPGTIAMTQLVSGSITYTASVGPAYGQTMAGALDGPIRYRGPVSSRTRLGPAPYDAPAVGLRSTDASVSVAETFTSYFMYKPKAHGDWVTLKKGSWNWTAGATLVDAATNRWCVNGSQACSAQAPVAIGAVGALQDSMDLPSWSTTFDAGVAAIKPRAPYTSLYPHP